MAPDTFAGLALWLVPTVSHEREILQQEMDSLRLANADCSSAAFPPHTTLVAGISEEGNSQITIWNAFLEGLGRWRRTNDAAAKLPIVCTLEAVVTRGIYFQCIVIALTINSALVSLNEEMRTTFALHDQPAYFPHCSLLYAPFSAQDASKQIEDMHRRKVWESAAEEKTIAFGGGSSRLKSISLGRIELWNCNGPVSDWKRLNSLDL